MRAVLFVLVAASTTACIVDDVEPLANWSDVTASVTVYAGEPSWADDTNGISHVQVNLDYAGTKCLTLASDTRAEVDGIRPSYFERGHFSEDSPYDHVDEEYCVTPAFYIDAMPPAKPRSIVRLADDSAELSIEVGALFVEPPMRLLTPLARGGDVRIAVDDARPIEKASVQWQSDRGYFSFEPTIAAGELAFTLPANIAGSGTLYVDLQLASPEVACNGFARCDVTVMAYGAFVESIQP